MSETPIVDLPPNTTIIMEGDTQVLAESMSDAEMKALIIMTYRHVERVVSFCHELGDAIRKFQKGGMAGMLGLLRTNGSKN